MLLAVVVLLPVGWFGVRQLIRERVDANIQRSVDQALPEFRLLDQGGREWRREDLLGHRAVLHFFRSHCGSCDGEAAAWRTLEQELPAAVTVLHVMTDAVLGFDATATQATLQREGFRRPVLMADAAFVNALHTTTWANVTPITYLVDATGTIRLALRGAQGVETVAAAVAGLE